jgi:hypothetical protein
LFIIQASNFRAGQATRLPAQNKKEKKMDRRVIWYTLLALLVVGIVAGGGYGLYRFGRAHGYREGLAENVDDERLATFIEKGCDVERWSRNLGWEDTPLRRGFASKRISSPPAPVRLFFLGLVFLVLLLVVRGLTRGFSRASGGSGWQLSFGPRPPADSPPSTPENAE